MAPPPSLRAQIRRLQQREDFLTARWQRIDRLRWDGQCDGRRAARIAQITAAVDRRIGDARSRRLALEHRLRPTPARAYFTVPATFRA